MNLDIIENNLVNTIFVLLFITFITEWANLIIINDKNVNKIIQVLNININVLLVIVLTVRWTVNRYFPLSNLYESLLFLTWSITFINIFLINKSNSKIIGAITTPISLFVISFTSILIPENMKIATPLVPALRSNWLMMHVSIMMISYGTLMVGSLMSIVFLIISLNSYTKIQGNSDNNYKKLLLKYEPKDSATLFNNSYQDNIIKTIYKYDRLNLLEIIDNLSYRIIGLGFPLLTVGIIAGAVWANEAWGSYWSWDPKETWALITWLIFAIYLHTRLQQSWQGKKPAIIASIGFAVIWICYLGVNFLSKGLHSYGWIS
uniref:Cytochrome c biogenesis protein CcsA n=1 Tax=Platysiphonia delicata TaxID=2006979 RepID=A0A1Z1M195_9FLOR|nr:cytochrome c biogenesis protein ccs1 [Platysiphonia delicata]ARW59544.1 cytochrome c biogenesis protein ccs1 [Platysiphonia delicata]